MVRPIFCTELLLLLTYGFYSTPCMDSCGIRFLCLSCLMMRLRPWASCLGFSWQKVIISGSVPTF